MKCLQQYLRGHRFVYWFVLVAISFAVYLGGEAFFGKIHWDFVIFMSLAQPTGIVLFSNLRDKN